MKNIEGSVTANTATIAIAISRFNRFINNNLLEGAIDILVRVGCIKNENITIVWVPGSYELPLVIKALAVKNQYHALIAIGTIIKGVTAHFDLILKSCNYGLSNISIDHMLPIGLGLLVVDDVGQAIERSGIKNNNKGAESALAVLEMINVLNKIDSID